MDNALIGRIISKIESLEEEPRPRACRKLRGEKNLWRIRVGDYRVVYAVDDVARNVDIRRVRHRSEVYE
ncbi:MAG: type II toxin-antitoxin system RelE/ParE family toxin [Ignavibacteriae bacterium]|nr:type II toxin-antitoxin system RelE/ParE family toxin [Ignavibacteriota bacterium]